MPRRGENIYKRKDGRWEGRILKTDRNYQYVYAHTYKEVKEKVRNYHEQEASSEPKPSADNFQADVLFEQWLNSVAIYRVKPTTYENYYYCLKKYVIPFFKDSGNNLITEHSVAQFVKFISGDDTLSDSYKRKILSIFKTVLRQIPSSSPDYPALAETVKLPKKESSSIPVFSINEQRLVENEIYKSEDKRALGIILCFYTGIRLGELCALKWSDLDFEAGTMSVVRTVSRTKNFESDESKTELLVGTPKSQKSIRKIPLPKFLIKLFEKSEIYREDKNTYFLSGTDVPADPRAYQKLYKKMLASAGVKERKFHALRHTFATRALELGVDIKTLSEILGHSNITITLNIYTHSLMEQKKIAMDKLNELHFTHMTNGSNAVTEAVKTA